MKRKLLLTLTLATALLTPAVRGEETNHWRLDTSLNLFLAGLNGDVAVKGQSAKVNASFGDIFDQLDVAAAGRVTVGYDRWFLSTEFSYMKLKASSSAANVDLKQWLVEPSLGYQFCENFAVFAGARYNNIDGEIKFAGPLGLVRGGTRNGGTRSWACNSASRSSHTNSPSTGASTWVVSALVRILPGRRFRI